MATQVDVAIDGGVAVITGQGDFTHGYPIAQLSEGFSKASDANANKVVFDASNVQLVVSTALGVLIRVHKELAAAGGRLVVVPSSFFNDILEETQLNNVFTIARDLASARRTVGG